MPRVELDAEAPDFALENHRGRTVQLSDFRGQRHIVLVLNRGFT